MLQPDRYKAQKAATPVLAQLQAARRGHLFLLKLPNGLFQLLLDHRRRGKVNNKVERMRQMSKQIEAHREQTLVRLVVDDWTQERVEHGRWQCGQREAKREQREHQHDPSISEAVDLAIARASSGVARGMPTLPIRVARAIFRLGLVERIAQAVVQLIERSGGQSERARRRLFVQQAELIHRVAVL